MVLGSGLSVQALFRLATSGNLPVRMRALRDGSAAIRCAAAGAGIRTGVLDALAAGPCETAAVASAVGATTPELLEPFLRVLAAQGLVREVRRGVWTLARRGWAYVDDRLLRAAALAFGGYHTDLYQGLAAQLRGASGRTDIADEGETIASLSLAFEPFVEEVLRSTVRRVAPERVIDLGCGSGNLLALMLRTAPGAVGLGVDADPAAVELSRATLEAAGLTSRASVHHGDARHAARWIDEHGGPADLALLANVIYYVPRAERVAFLAALGSVLRPGGTLLLMTTAAEPDPFVRHFDLLLRAQRLGMELPAIADLLADLTGAGFADAVARRLVAGAPLHEVTARFVGSPGAGTGS